MLNRAEWARSVETKGNGFFEGFWVAQVNISELLEIAEEGAPHRRGNLGS